ncbi:MAG TPA: M20/M25/M40 family metallo-hydrolase [Kribbellaceae bacterium]|nr:M20/M25/M40 family metallo-hydrolase [Kribbellaceae bacterium]
MTDPASEVQAWMDERADEMAELLTRLIACETENPPGRGLAECAAVLREEMERLGLSPEVIEIEPTGSIEDPRIVRGTVGTGKELVYFHGHFDVVPVQDRAQFTAERRNGRIIGRGTADMKGGIVSMLYGAAAARELGLLGDGRIVIHLVCDEETGSAVGSGYLREHNLIAPGALAMMTAEQSGEVIWNAAKGALSMRVDVLGRPIHVGQAFKGVNSFLHMLKVAAPLEAYAQEMSQRHTRYPVGEGEALGTMVVVGGESGGGSNFNVVPAQTYFTIDGRFNPEEDIDAELTRITATVNDAAKDAGAEVSIQVTQVAPPADTPLSNKAARVLGECVTDITGSPARYELCAGCLDTRWYTQLGIPAFGFGPGRLEVSHGPNEYVEEAALRRVAAVYTLFAAKLFNRAPA